jgi:hypothetical protein
MAIHNCVYINELPDGTETRIETTYHNKKAAMESAKLAIAARRYTIVYVIPMHWVADMLLSVTTAKWITFSLTNPNGKLQS